ncbi:MAG: gamma-glutamyl-gamma-aminobutyrate hydrolase family protein [Deltaproteobacteria bacterium]|nr:gamma-glutamyl-gamma-aminobutyrate hydrolase family protein [Deltaproteobacteria bacterium]
MPRALVLQHVAVEGPAALGEALQRRGVELQAVRIFAGEPVPAQLEADALVVMGGPMGVYESDRYPHLSDELRLIEATLGQGRPVIGTCLGSQLLAAALGARVYPNTRKEIGWYEVELAAAARDDRLFAAAPPRFTPVHWHGDIFDLPNGAVRLARSAISPTQAYRYGDNAYGLLFHLELRRPHLDSWMTAFADELVSEQIAPASIITPDVDARLAAADAVGAPLFDRFAALIAGS